MRGRFIGWVIAVLLIVIGFAKPFAGRVNAAPPIAYDSIEDIFLNNPMPIMLNVYDADTLFLTYTIVTAPMHGILSGAPGIDLVYTPAVDYIGGDSFGFSVSDGANSDTGTVTLNVYGYDVPVITNPAAEYADGFPMLTAASGVPIVFGGASGDFPPFVISDAEPTSAAYEVSVTGSYTSTITLATTQNLTFTMGDGTNDSQIIFTGSLPAINMALDGMTFVPSASLLAGQSTRLHLNARDASGFSFSGVQEVFFTIAPPFEDTYVVHGSMDACDQLPSYFYSEVIPLHFASDSKLVMRFQATVPADDDRVTELTLWGDGTEYPSPIVVSDAEAPYEMTVYAPAFRDYFLVVQSAQTGDYTITIEGTNLDVGTPWDCHNDSLYDASVTFHIDLQGRPAPPHSQWEIPLRAVYIEPAISGTNWRRSWQRNVTLGADGDFTWERLPSGTGEIWIQNLGALRLRVENVTLASGHNMIALGTLTAGDANDDWFVDARDAQWVAYAFAAATGDPRFRAAADFNYDGLVNILDFSLLALNFGATAD